MTSITHQVSQIDGLEIVEKLGIQSLSALEAPYLLQDIWEEVVTTYVSSAFLEVAVFFFGMMNPIVALSYLLNFKFSALSEKLYTLGLVG